MIRQHRAWIGSCANCAQDSRLLVLAHLRNRSLLRSGPRLPALHDRQVGRLL
jgi:hypothetical protein